MRDTVSPAARPFEVWGSLHPSVRGDAVPGERRADELEAAAQLGLDALRCPIPWAQIAPRGPSSADFDGIDGRLARMRDLGVRPVVELVTAGRTPTSLRDPALPEALAGFARSVAERYPWILDYTPIGSPTSVARAGEPTGADEAAFFRALVTECRAIALAMRAIRSVTPGARLVQTEAMGHTFGSRKLASPVRRDNALRYLGVDLLAGLVDLAHPLREEMLEHGVTSAELACFLSDPCPPDVVAIEYDIKSDRFLDERLELYPERLSLRHGRHEYVEVEAVRARPAGIVGHAEVLRRVWSRYRLPVALAGVHIDGPREEQLRWLSEAWRAAHELRGEGAEVRAVTVGLLGSTGETPLPGCRDGGWATPGALDASGPSPRPTEVARMLGCLAAGAPYAHPVLAGRGSWRRAERLAEVQSSQRVKPSHAGRGEAGSAPQAPGERRSAREILITGASGMLGRALSRVCEQRGLAHRLLARHEMDIGDPVGVARALDKLEPWAVVNAAGFAGVDEAERDAARCERENTLGPAVLAAACRERSIRLVTFSSDLVFDGAQRAPYVESSGVAPLGVYGRCQAEAERRVLELLPGALVVRTSALFGWGGAGDFASYVLGAALGGGPIRAACDAVVSPTFVPDLAHATLDLLVDGEGGLWHLANQGALPWDELARRLATLAGKAPENVVGCVSASLGLDAPRPRYSALGSERGSLMPPLEDALERFLATRSAAADEDCRATS